MKTIGAAETVEGRSTEPTAPFMTSAPRSAHGSASGTGAGELVPGRVKVFLTERAAGVEVGEGRTVHALQAASCLLAPAIGDRVLVYVERDEAHILAVLERDAERIAEVAVPGAGHVVLQAEDKLDLNAAKVTVTAGEVNIFARAISKTGEILSSHFRRILETAVDKTVGARTITTRAQTRSAIVSEVDTVKAGTLVQNVETVATQNSEISLMTAKQDVRLDATRVSVG